MAGAGGVLIAMGKHRSFGSTEEEQSQWLPGDDMLDRALIQNDRGIVIPAPPEKVWPWIAQLGQNKAGFYSFEALENMAGCDITNANKIHPEWQDVRVGDRVPLAPEMFLRVAEVEPGRYLVLTTEGGGFPAEAADHMNFDFTWCFHVAPKNGGSRLHVRERYNTNDASTAGMLQRVSIVSAIMSWKMLRSIKKLSTT